MVLFDPMAYPVLDSNDTQNNRSRASDLRHDWLRARCNSAAVTDRPPESCVVTRPDGTEHVAYTFCRSTSTQGHQAGDVTVRSRRVLRRRCCRSVRRNTTIVPARDADVCSQPWPARLRALRPDQRADSGLRSGWWHSGSSSGGPKLLRYEALATPRRPAGVPRVELRRRRGLAVRAGTQATCGGRIPDRRQNKDSVVLRDRATRTGNRTAARTFSVGRRTPRATRSHDSVTLRSLWHAVAPVESNDWPKPGPARAMRRAHCSCLPGTRWSGFVRRPAPMQPHFHRRATK